MYPLAIMNVHGMKGGRERGHVWEERRGGREKEGRTAIFVGLRELEGLAGLLVKCPEPGLCAARPGPQWMLRGSPHRLAPGESSPESTGRGWRGIPADGGDCLLITAFWAERQGATLCGPPRHVPSCPPEEALMDFRDCLCERGRARVWHVSNVSVQWGREEQVGAKIQSHFKRFGDRFCCRSRFCQQEGLLCSSKPAGHGFVSQCPVSWEIISQRREDNLLYELSCRIPGKATLVMLTSVFPFRAGQRSPGFCCIVTRTCPPS